MSLMDKAYDKLLFLMGLLVLSASGIVAVAWVPMPNSPSSSPAVVLQGAAFVPQPVPAAKTKPVHWPEAQPQPSGWVYDLFTPPQIFLGPDGSFTIHPPYEDSATFAPFGLYLAKLERPLYRIQLDGYIEEEFTEGRKTLLLFYDRETDSSLRARVGDTLESAAFEVLSFDVVRRMEGDGSLTKAATAKILDCRTGVEKTFIHGQALYADRIEIVLRSAEDETVEIRPTAIGESFLTPFGKFQVEAIDFEGASITLKKLESDASPEQTETLTLSSPPETIAARNLENPNESIPEDKVIAFFHDQHFNYRA